MTLKHLLEETTVNLSVTLYESEGECPFPLVDEFLVKFGFNIKYPLFLIEKFLRRRE